MDLIDTPIDLLEYVAALRLAPEMEARQRVLIARKELGVLTPSEERELAGSIALGSQLTGLREQAEQLLCDAITPVYIPRSPT